ncbi:MAG: hypothetical protein K9K82_13345 [Desulfobacteraceae bacterium]|nr:hypothetical protein [Desulfobacteraceae bacterium]
MENRLPAIVALLFFAAVFFPQSAPALEKLSKEEMQGLTGQAGFSLAADNAVFFYYSDAMKFQDVNTVDMTGDPLTPEGFAKFDVSALLTVDDYFDLDVGVFYREEPLTFDDQTDPNTPDTTITREFDHPLNNTAMIFLSQQADEPQLDLSIQNISVYNHSLDAQDTEVHDPQAESLIGDVDVTNARILESRGNLFPPAGDNASGIRAVGGTRMQIGSLTYANPEQTTGLTVSDIMIGAGFTGDALPEGPSSANEMDTSTWAFDTGVFEIGRPYYFHDDPAQEDTTLASYPASLDFSSDDTRAGDFQSYVAINAPVRGSIRIKNVSSSNFNMGPIAIDGIRLYKNYIEFPGRGIGN